jgi:hypothetical protein
VVIADHAIPVEVLILGNATSSSLTQELIAATLLPATSIVLPAASGVAANYKSTVVRLYITGTAGQTVNVNVVRAPGPIQTEPLMVATAFPAGGILMLSGNSEATVIMYQPLLLLPGDGIEITNNSSGDNVNYSYEAATVPL